MESLQNVVKIYGRDLRDRGGISVDRNYVLWKIFLKRLFGNIFKVELQFMEEVSWKNRENA
jgi:hypothetical protein